MSFLVDQRGRRFMRLVWVLMCSVLVGCLAIPSLAQVEDEVLHEMNRARTQPELYAKELRDYWDRVTFRGTIYQLPRDQTHYITHEGRSAVDEAIAFIERQRPIPPLRHSGAHALAARDLAASQGPKGVDRPYRPGWFQPAGSHQTPWR